MNEIDKRRKYSERRSVWLRNYQRARARALTKLAQQYPDQYKELLEQERLSDEVNGKAWSDITGRTSLTEGSSGSPNRGGQISKQHTDRDTEDEGDLE